MAGLIFKARQPYAGFIVHMGLVLMFMGFAGQAFQHEETAVISTGESKAFGPYKLRFEGMTQTRDLIKESFMAEIAVSSDGKNLGRLHPGREFYDQRPNEPVSQVAIHRSIREDLYITLGSYDDATRAVALKLVRNPLVDWMWLGFLVMAFGALLILVPPRAQEAEAGHRTLWVHVGGGLGVAGLAAIIGRTVLHMPASAQLFTLGLCGLTIGLAGLACYSLLQSLMVPVDGADAS